MNILKDTLLPVTCLMATVLLIGCSEPPPPETKLRPVKSYTVTGGEGATRARVFSGAANASQEAELSFKVKGSIKTIGVEVGDQVTSGDLIAELDASTYRVELEQANASTAQSNATRRSTESEYQRIRQLYTNNNASQNELDGALADAESARAQHNADVQNTRLAKLNLDYTRLLADANCSVATIEAEVNENVSAGQRIAQVNCGDNWEIKIAVPESLIALFKRGMEGSVSFPSIPKQAYMAIVTEVGVGTLNSATFPVTFSLNNPPDNIRSNLAAEVAVKFAYSNDNVNVLHVPIAAVVKDEQGTYVYLMEATEQAGAARLKRQSVEVGEISTMGIEILNGLQEGDQIVIAGQINARNGMLVRNQP